jgi:hypothetical protein
VRDAIRVLVVDSILSSGTPGRNANGASANRRRRRARTQRRDLARCVSHELRTPPFALAHARSIACAGKQNAQACRRSGWTKFRVSHREACGQLSISKEKGRVDGAIRSSSLDESNVDLAQPCVNLIVAQRAFQANTRTVSVANELLSNLVNLGQ